MKKEVAQARAGAQEAILELETVKNLLAERNEELGILQAEHTAQ